METLALKPQERVMLCVMPQDPVTFQDVTVEFTQEEWEHLGTAQRALYCEGARIPSPMWSPSWSKVDLHGWRGGESLGASLQVNRWEGDQETGSRTEESIGSK
ncbi:zinc finger protein 2-like isoform X7 [Pteropus medius]|uniref:zinc finger protein 2-like isoform X7 n=1 Tax=Pteropus vampyrus TaxID=132908 RepID=UPI00196A91D2|nr:zinc finger protein 2-like isoform X7 [Pteropus giganteus]